MDLLREVINVKSGIRGLITEVSIKFENEVGGTTVKWTEFVDSFEEYVDPKDIEIARLLKIIEEFEKPKERKKRTKVTKEEKEEARVHIEAGLDIKEIAAYFDVDVSTVYSWITAGKWNFKGRKRGPNIQKTC